MRYAMKRTAKNRTFWLIEAIEDFVVCGIRPSVHCARTPSPVAGVVHAVPMLAALVSLHLAHPALVRRNAERLVSVSPTPTEPDQCVPDLALSTLSLN